ncbi:MAG TPA: hypothetical protein VGF42_01460 [Caulobacteraceae bacterium]
MSDMTLPQSRAVLSESDMEAIRAYHRSTRNLGYLCCLLGVLALVAGRFMSGAPTWLMSLGLGVVIFGWGLLAYAVARRVALVRRLMSGRGA